MEYNAVVDDNSSHCTTVVPAFALKCLLFVITSLSQIKSLKMPEFLQRSRMPAITSQYSIISQAKLIVTFSGFSGCNNSADFKLFVNSRRNFQLCASIEALGRSRWIHD